LIAASSWFGFGAYVWLLSRVSAARLSSDAFVNPLVAVALGGLFLAEPLTLGLGQAAVLILSGWPCCSCPFGQLLSLGMFRAHDRFQTRSSLQLAASVASGRRARVLGFAGWTEPDDCEAPT
jgi:hypothetical protein